MPLSARWGRRGARPPVEAAVERLEELKARARELGIFTHDRGLLSCPKCGLIEDVHIDGRLATCWPDRLGCDTGLRFIEERPGPGAGCVVGARTSAYELDRPLGGV